MLNGRRAAHVSAVETLTPADTQPQVGDDQGGKQDQHGDHRKSELFIMPQEDPGDIRQASQAYPPTGAPQAWIFSLRRKSLKDRKRDQPDVNQPPDGKHIASRHKINLEAVGDCPGILPVDGQGIGEHVDHDGSK